MKMSAQVFIPSVQVKLKQLKQKQDISAIAHDTGK